MTQGTKLERLRSFLARRPHDVWRGLQQWKATPDSDAVWAWFAEWCGVYETCDSDDPIQLARAEGRREAFFALYDLAGVRGRDILEVQERALRGGGDE